MNVIIFTFNRAMQCELLLQSLKRNTTLNNIIVTYNYSKKKFLKSYEELINQKREKWISQKGHIFYSEEKSRNHYKQERDEWLKNNNFGDFLLNLININKKYTVFFCDDDIVYKRINLQNIEKVFDDNVICFSLRLGLNTYMHYGTKECLTEYQEIDKFIKWEWRKYSKSNNYGYPYAIPATIYKTEDIIGLLKKVRFATVNHFESSLQNQLKRSKKYLTSFREGCVVNVPVNLVQKDYINNFHGQKYPQDINTLNKLFLKGYRIDYNALDFSNINSTHKEIQYKYCK